MTSRFPWHRCRILLAFAAGALASSARADGGTPKQIVASIRKLYAETNEALRAGRSAELVFFTDADGFSGRRWKQASTTSERARAEEQDFLAKVSVVDGRTVKAVFRARSPSRDWENTTEYDFYPDGKTAFRFERHVTSLANLPETFTGPYVVEKRRYLDESGRVVRDVVRAFVESSGKGVPASDVQQIDTGSYESADALPFANQVRRKSGSR